PLRLPVLCMDYSGSGGFFPPHYFRNRHRGRAPRGERRRVRAPASGSAPASRCRASCGAGARFGAGCSPDLGRWPMVLTMSSGAATPRPAKVADLLAIPEGERFHEIVDGVLVRKPTPSFRHGCAQFRLSNRIGGPYDRRPGRGGPGGWRFATEVEITF